MNKLYLNLGIIFSILIVFVSCEAKTIGSIDEIIQLKFCKTKITDTSFFSLMSDSTFYTDIENNEKKLSVNYKMIGSNHFIIKFNIGDWVSYDTLYYSHNFIINQNRDTLIDFNGGSEFSQLKISQSNSGLGDIIRNKKIINSELLKCGISVCSFDGVTSHSSNIAKVYFHKELGILGFVYYDGQVSSEYVIKDVSN